ncbi:translation elongation factor Ts [Nostoc sp. T09]|uniref:translation elongation factor Ts n=1 Tax=Nostoc sp. T09 TaxID=1932621 RepID=UPI000A39F849|nr:translation elongation factor Ts [Nostoc sp. T09]OUL21958.1 translation elongation factor Ts [Nostoc sp. T09]
MAEISAKQVQELRQKTNAGMMDCKKALQENDGDLEKAIDWLRQKGIAKGGTKGDRIAAEGLVDTYIQPGSQVGVLIEVNCQTDFVARNDAFKALVKNLAKQAVTADSVESLLTQPYIEDQSLTVEDFIKQVITTLGENIKVRRFVNFSLAEGKSGIVDSYIHTGGRVGVLVEIDSETDAVVGNEEFQGLARNAAMQVAACPNVEYVSVDEIPTEVAARETEVEMGRDDLASKPQNIKEKIVQGRIEKRLKEFALLDQPFIRDQSISVEDLVKQVKSKLGQDIKIKRFVRYVLGEGIEKQESNFAEEVAAQMGTK